MYYKQQGLGAIGLFWYSLAVDEGPLEDLVADLSLLRG